MYDLYIKRTMIALSISLHFNSLLYILDVRINNKSIDDDDRSVIVVVVDVVIS